MLIINFNLLRGCKKNTNGADVGRAIVGIGDISATGRVNTLLGVRNCVFGIKADQLLLSSSCELNGLEESNRNAMVLEEFPGMQEGQLLQLKNAKI